MSHSIYENLQSIYKFFHVIKYRKIFTDLNAQAMRMYDERSTVEESEIVKSCLNITTLTARFLFVLYSSCIFLFLVYPLNSYIFENKLTLIFEIYVPFIDHEASIFGFTVTTITHIIFEMYALTGIGGFDLALLTFTFSVVAMTDLFHYDLKLVEKFLLTEDMKDVENHRKVQEMMKNIFLSHKTLIQCV